MSFIIELLSLNVTSIEIDANTYYTYFQSLNADPTFSLEVSADFDCQNELLDWGIVRFQLDSVENSVIWSRIWSCHPKNLLYQWFNWSS